MVPHALIQNACGTIFCKVSEQSMCVEKKAENRDVRVGSQHDILAVLCDVGGVLIHKKRTPELQKWEHRFGLEPMSLPLAIWLSKSSLRATLGEAAVNDGWHEIQQKYTLTDTELEAFKYDFAASDYLDIQFAHFLRNVRKTRKAHEMRNEIIGRKFLVKKKKGASNRKEMCHFPKGGLFL